jgi:HEAT repeat protein
LKTEDDETRRACLDSLAQINNRKANDELLRISQDKNLEPVWKERVLAYLGRPHPDSPLAASQGKSRTERSGQQ